MVFGNVSLSILIYHRVLRTRDPLQPALPTVMEFERHMRWLARLFNVLPLRNAARRLKDGTLPPRAVAITFDDGYADNHDVALPILQKLGLHATFFVATGFLDGGRMWNDTVIEAVRQWPGDHLSLEPLGIEGLPMAGIAEKKRSISTLLSALKHRPLAERTKLAEALGRQSGGAASSLMMTSGQVRALHESGMTIGGHTRWHPILNVIPDDQAYAEIRDGKQDLETILNRPIHLFAYPNGRPEADYSTRHARMVQQIGFQAAVTTAWGAADGRADLYQIPRFTPWDRTTLGFLGRLTHVRCTKSQSVAHA